MSDCLKCCAAPEVPLSLMNMGADVVVVVTGDPIPAVQSKHLWALPCRCVMCTKGEQGWKGAVHGMEGRGAGIQVCSLSHLLTPCLGSKESFLLHLLLLREVSFVFTL